MSVQTPRIKNTFQYFPIYQDPQKPEEISGVRNQPINAKLREVNSFHEIKY